MFGLFALPVTHKHSTVWYSSAIGWMTSNLKQVCRLVDDLNREDQQDLLCVLCHYEHFYSIELPERGRESGLWHWPKRRSQAISCSSLPRPSCSSPHSQSISRISSRTCSSQESQLVLNKSRAQNERLRCWANMWVGRTDWRLPWLAGLAVWLDCVCIILYIHTVHTNVVWYVHF